MKPQEYWNKLAADKTFTTDFNLPLFAPLVAKDAAILDVGCGYGRVMALLWEKGYRNLLGIDPSEALIHRGRRLFPHLHLQIQTPENLLTQIKTGSIDVILLYAVLTCIPKDEEQKKLLTEAKRALKPGGLIFCSDFLLNQDQRNLDRYQQHAQSHSVYGVFEVAPGTSFRHHSEKHIKNLFADFTVEHYQKQIHKTMHGNRSNGFHLIARKPDGNLTGIIR